MFNKNFIEKFNNKIEIKNFIEIIEKLESQNYFVDSDFTILENACYLIDEFYDKEKEKQKFLTTTKIKLVENEIAVLNSKKEYFSQMQSYAENEIDSSKIEVEIKTLEAEIYKKQESLNYKYFKFNKNGEFVENHDFRMKEQIRAISDILEKVGMTTTIRNKMEAMLSQRGTKGDSLFDAINEILKNDEATDHVKKS